MTELTPEQQLLSQQENVEQHWLAHAELSPQELELRQHANAEQMRNAISSQESNNYNGLQLNNAGEAFSYHIRSIPDCYQLVGFEFNAEKSLMMFHENHYSILHDLMNDIWTEGPSAPGDLPNKSKQNMINTLEEMKITPKKQQRIQCSCHSLHERHACILGCCSFGICCIMPTVTAEGDPIPLPVLKVFPTDPMFGPFNFTAAEVAEWHLHHPVKQTVWISKLSEADGNRYHVHQELINLRQVMDGGDDFSLIMRGLYLHQVCKGP